MKIKVGENIKRMRKNKNITQEQLSEVFNVSCAAVSKWETGETYPDITLLFPLAHYFNISIDELMGYDETKIDDEIESILSEYSSLQYQMKYHEASEIIKEARKKYPHNYKVLHRYMFDIAGGLADNDSMVIKENADELEQICDIILQGCIDEKIRLDALTLKAKIYYAKGMTDKSLKLLNQFPSFYHSSNQRKEQLFAKNSDDYFHQLVINLYELAIFTADKFAKSIIYDNTLTIEEKIIKINKVGTYLSSVNDDKDFETFVFISMGYWGRIVSRSQDMLKLDDSCVINYCQKYYESIKQISIFSEKNETLKEFIKDYYNRDNLLQSIISGMEKRLPKSVVNNQEYISIVKKVQSM